MTDVVVLDLETTGLYYEEGDEILQVAAIDFNWNTIIDEYVKPLHKKRWKRTYYIHGISPRTVKDKPAISAYKELLVKILKSKIIVGYNVEFDINFLINGLELESEEFEIRTFDVMKTFAEIYGDWSELYGNYKYQKLTKCADYYGYYWGVDSAHDALSDCRATLFCMKEMLEGLKKCQIEEYRYTTE